MTQKKPQPETAQQAAQQVWLAGLEALTRAQQQGGRMFEALVQEGLAMQKRAQAATGSPLGDVGQRVQQMGQDLGKEFTQRASAPWEKLEGLFEERVARAVERLGYPPAGEIQALRERVAALEDALKTAQGHAPAQATGHRGARGTRGKSA